MRKCRRDTGPMAVEKGTNVMIALCLRSVFIQCSFSVQCPALSVQRRQADAISSEYHVKDPS